MADELKPCPFCDGDRVDYDSFIFTRKGTVLYAKYPDCGTNFRVLEHIYNTRPSDARQAREIAELRDKCLAQAAEIERLRGALSIRSMNDAPKDGTQIILVTPENIFVTASYRKEEYILGRSRDKYWVVDGTFQDEQGGEMCIDDPIGWIDLAYFREVLKGGE